MLAGILFSCVLKVRDLLCFIISRGNVDFMLYIVCCRLILIDCGNECLTRVWNFGSSYLDEINQVVELNFFFLDFELRIAPRGILFSECILWDLFNLTLNSFQHFLISQTCSNISNFTYIHYRKLETKLTPMLRNFNF